MAPAPGRTVETGGLGFSTSSAGDGAGVCEAEGAAEDVGAGAGGASAPSAVAAGGVGATTGGSCGAGPRPVVSREGGEAGGSSSCASSCPGAALIIPATKSARSTRNTPARAVQTATPREQGVSPLLIRLHNKIIATSMTGNASQLNPENT